MLTGKRRAWRARRRRIPPLRNAIAGGGASTARATRPWLRLAVCLLSALNGRPRIRRLECHTVQGSGFPVLGCENPEPLNPEPSPMQQSRSITRKSASNLALAFVLLPRAKRLAMCALYAFCREVDDVADNESLPIQERRRQLGAWRTDLRRACAAQDPQLAVNRELQPVIRQYRLPFELFDQLLQGVEMDMDVQRYPTYQELESTATGSPRWSACSASRSLVTGTRPAAAMPSSSARPSSSPTSSATFRADARRGRIYLPLAELARCGVAPEEILRGEYSERYFQLAAGTARRARHFYRLARQTLPVVDRRAMVAAELMGSVYWRLLRQLQEHRFNVFGAEPIRLHKGRKLWLVLRAWCRWACGAAPYYGADTEPGQGVAEPEADAGP